MATRRDTWRAILAALVVAVGLAVAWGVVGNWGGVRSSDRSYFPMTG